MNTKLGERLDGGERTYLCLMGERLSMNILLKKRAKETVSWTVGLVTAGILCAGSVYFGRGSMGGGGVSNFLTIALGIVGGIGFLLGILQCAMLRSVVGLVVLCASAGLALHDDLGAIVIYAGCATSVFFAVFLAQVTYDELSEHGRSNTSARIGEPENLHCSSCKAKSFCTFKPGGLIDEYTHGCKDNQS